MKLVEYLGENSYPAIKQKLFESINSCKPSTLKGEKMLHELKVNLNESSTPMMQIKAFETNAESVSKEDVNLSEILKFISKTKEQGDFNFLINLCKEEHFANMRRMNVPTPEETLSEIEHLFDEPNNAVIEAINKNLFNGIESQLYNDIKTDLTNSDSISPETGFPKSKNKIQPMKGKGVVLNENTGLVKFNPVAVKYVQPDGNIYLTPFSALQSVKNNENKWQVVDVNLPPSYQKLSNALANLNYDYENDEFKTTEGLWDFDMCINSAGECEVSSEENGRKTIESNDLKEFFVESMNWAPDPTLKDQMIEEADNFIALANNYNKLIKLDEISVIKNDNNYIVIDDNEKLPKLLVNSKTNEVSFDLFSKMIENLNESFGENVAPTFDSKLSTEADIITGRYAKREQLTKDKANLDMLIESTQKILSISDKDSPSFQKATKELKQLNEAMSLNFQEFDKLNIEKLYESV